MRDKLLLSFIIVFVTVGIGASIAECHSPITDPESLSDSAYQDLSVADLQAKYQHGRPKEKLDIGYLLFTPHDTSSGCLMTKDDTQSVGACNFNASLPTKFITHGYYVVLVHESIFFTIKDKILQKEHCNVIVTNYTRYNGPPYTQAVLYTVQIAEDIASFIAFLMAETGLQAQSIHMIGHSLGAHVFGFVGKQVPSIGRITGLDPAFPFFNTLSEKHRLWHTDAIFVDVIHTSSPKTGYGIHDPLGHMDFYPNGGERQPHCYYGNTFRYTDGTKETVNSTTYISCVHDIVNDYFIDSIDEAACRFTAVSCCGYSAFEWGLCLLSPVVPAEMGYNARRSPLPSRAKFFLETNVEENYCKADGYKPSWLTHKWKLF